MTACASAMQAHLVGTSSRTELPVTLYYRAADPYTVTVTIGAQRIDWDFSRELLRTGTAQPTGAGDVRLWPGRRTGDDQLFLHLRSPSGQALLELPRTAVLDFLEDTETLVPTGTECFALPLDAELEALMNDGPS
jgi:hypothetical protein